MSTVGAAPTLRFDAFGIVDREGSFVPPDASGLPQILLHLLRADLLQVRWAKALTDNDVPQGVAIVARL